MKLHNDKQAFSDTILSVSRELNIVPALIEKDYYVTLLLKALKNKIPGLLFKGGTSLSKCHKIIDRFSEDIDLTLDSEHYSQSRKRKANKAVIEACDELGFTLANREFVEKHSHGNYNVYNIEYPILFPSNDIKPYLKVEMVFIQKAFPDEIKFADSYLGSWLINNGNSGAAEQFDLLPFQIRVQSLERTLVDKVFALCDYYLRDEESRNSRHIYDISRILTKVKINDELKTLVGSVREVRKPNKTSLSAQDGVNVPELLKKIVDSGFFKKDYENSTEKLLIKPVRYGDAIKSLETIIDSGLFANNNKIPVDNKTPTDDEYAPPSVIYEKWKAEQRAKKMEGRGFESLTRLSDMCLYDDTKKLFESRGNSKFEDLYYGDQVYKDEETNERQLMMYLAVLSNNDKEMLLRVFKSSGQYNKDKPDDYYDKMADACLKDIADSNEKPRTQDYKPKTPINKGNDNFKS